MFFLFRRELVIWKRLDVPGPVSPHDTRAEASRRRVPRTTSLFHQDVRGMNPEILSGHLIVCVLLLLFTRPATSHVTLACCTAHAQPSPKKRVLMTGERCA